jgi:HD-GYP domain-containing protein (c-di-GMP phosphodiesterase class II)
MVMVFSKNKTRNATPDSGKGNIEMEEYQTRIELLTEIAEEASSITEVSTLLERILKVTQHTLGTTVTTLFLNDEKKSDLHSPFSVRNVEGAPHRRPTDSEIKVAKWVASNVEPVLINDIAADDRFNGDITDSSVSAIIAAPVMRGEKVIGVICSIDKEDGNGFTEGDFEVIKGFASTEALILLVSMQITAIDNYSQLALNQGLLDGYRSTKEAPATNADIEDSFGHAHSRRCKEYAVLTANRLGLPPREVKAIEFGALLHDIGKIGIGSEILCKPGPLTDGEWKIMYEHPRKGAEILGEIPYLKEARDIVLYHHERYDGQGYPEKLAGEDIPIGARVVAVANAFDAMTTDRAYRAALTTEEAIGELIHNMGTQFCPRATEAFISAFKKREDQPPLERNHEGLKAGGEEEVEEIITVKKDINDLNITIEEEREAKARKARAEQEAREQQARAEKEAREQREKEEKEARKQREKAEKEAKKEQARAEKEEKERQARAEKEAKEREKAEQEAGKQQEKAEREERARAEKELEEREKAEREAKEQQEKAEREEQVRAEKELEEREKAEREEREQQEKAEREEQPRAEREAEEREKAEREEREQREKAEREAEEQRKQAEEEAAREEQARAEKEEKEREKAEQEARERREKAEREAEAQRRKAEEDAAKEHQVIVEEEEKESEAAEQKFREWQARVEREAIREAQEKAEEEAKEREKAEQEEREAQAKAEEESAREEQARAEEEAKEREKAEQEERKWQNKVEKEASKNKKSAPAQKDTNGNIEKEMSRGDIRLVVPITTDLVEVRRFRKELERLEGLRIVLFGSSEEDGHMFVLSLPEPMALMYTVSQIALVENVGKKGKDILVTLKDGGHETPEEE